MMFTSRARIGEHQRILRICKMKVRVEESKTYPHLWNRNKIISFNINIMYLPTNNQQVPRTLKHERCNVRMNMSI